MVSKWNVLFFKCVVDGFGWNCKQPICGCTLRNALHGLRQGSTGTQSGINRGSTGTAGINWGSIGTAAEPGLNGDSIGNR
eukprot:4584189-Alexandrium_andersonii.AAC.1